MPLTKQALAAQAATLGWEHSCHTECDRCHVMAPCCAVDFWDGSGQWDYCQECWIKLSERGAFDGMWI
jgi:predicted Zn-dependent protease